MPYEAVPGTEMKRTHQSPLGEGENLIFAISQPRAGSTMLQKVLGAQANESWGTSGVPAMP